MRKLPFIYQKDAMDCGPSSLAMICAYHGKKIGLQYLVNLSEAGKEGVNLLGIAQAAEKVGLAAQAVKLNFSELKNSFSAPCILHWSQNHFVVLYRLNKRTAVIGDPAKGIIKISLPDFVKAWAGQDNEAAEGVVLQLQPTPAFYEHQYETGKRLGWKKLFGYIRQQRRLIWQVAAGLLLGSLLQFIFPFLTQAIVDVGIRTADVHFVYVVLIAQFMLFFGRTVVEFIRRRLLLFISIKINLHILSDFWIKLMNLPLGFFDTKKTGDIIQRLGDHKRIESFLTGSGISTVFSVFNLLVFSVVLLHYNLFVFLLFAGGSLLYFFWIRIFLRHRRNLDYKSFAVSSTENTATMQLIYGMQEIKLNGAEKLRRWEWERLQTQLFKLNFKSLQLSQYQQAGAFFINEGKNIIITFFVAKAVIEGHLTLGEMTAVQYIVGQLNSPVEQLISFVQQAQDARISMERLNEIHELKDEDQEGMQLNSLQPGDQSIVLEDVTFTYAGAGNEPALKNINLCIPGKKITAIVGMSGSGKTTLLKLLLKFYTDHKGGIAVNKVPLNEMTSKFWRSQCGTVMQEGFIYNDSIARNIAVSEAEIDEQRLEQACKTANILDYITSLPLGFHTNIGAEGNGLSTGQKQRILLARVVYKDPGFVFLDEATNNLDATNEKAIMENMAPFFKDKTVVVVAHRLSTVKHADHIVVLDKGRISEYGTHAELVKKKGSYYELVKNQLELGN